MARPQLSASPKGRTWTRCKCAIWVQGSIGGEWIKRSLNTAHWTAASAIVHEWQSSGRIGVLKPELPTVERAVEQFLEEATVRNLAATTIKKRRELLEGKLLPFCTHRGHRQLRDLTVERLREFRTDLDILPAVRGQAAGVPARFLRFCVEAGWIERNPAAALKPTKVPHKPTLPYTDAEVDRLLEAARAARRLRAVRPAHRADDPAAPLLRAAHAGCRLSRTRTARRRQAVPLPAEDRHARSTARCREVVVQQLDGRSRTRNERYFFYDGKSQPESMVKSWDRVFKKVGETADPVVSNCHPHRFRDTFAVSLLLKGVSLDSVSKLLGHSSIKITERHYAPWVKARQDQLESEVRRIWT